MKLIFAKTKRARIICALLSLLFLALALQAGYFAVGNLLCASDGPVLISDNGGAIFLGYYLLAGTYFSLLLASLSVCLIFCFNAINTLKTRVIK